MTTQELENKVCVGNLGYGQYRVTIEYRNHQLTCISNDSLSYDRISEHEYTNDKVKSCCGITYKQALEQLYHECLRKNDIQY